jgi:uncharacterized membrane protein
VKALAMIAALAGCGTDSANTCAPGDPKTVSWDSFGHGFTLARCQGCHASTATDRRSAPPDVMFDTEDDARAVAPRIRTAVIVNKTMPPGGGVSDTDLALVGAWLDCDFDSP